jgi:Zn-dependent protease with chaperone function
LISLHDGIRRVVNREQAHRAGLLIGMGVLLILSTVPVLGHHFVPVLFNPFTELQHLGALCAVALRKLFSPVHVVFHALLAFGLVYAAVDRVKGWRAAKRWTYPIDFWFPRPGERVWLAALRCGLDPLRVRIAEGLPNPAFTIGLLKPKVYVDSSLEFRLTEAELGAVISHEAAHVRHHDPLRVAACRFLACTLFWMPAVRRLADDFADDVEVAADDAARNGAPLVLASAILSLADWHDCASRETAAVGFQRDDLLDRRIRRLAGEANSPSTHVTRGSLGAAAAMLILVLTSGVVTAQPAHRGDQTSPMHCDHPRETLFSHLFCDGTHVDGCIHRGQDGFHGPP